jgi:hypothetical protein
MAASSFLPAGLRGCAGIPLGRPPVSCLSVLPYTDALGYIKKIHRQPQLASRKKHGRAAPLVWEEPFAHAASFYSCFNKHNKCWKATSCSVNPLDREYVNVLLRCFNSPAPQAYLAFQRTLDQSEDTFDVLQIFSYLLQERLSIRNGRIAVASSCTWC